jgi:hypothetical protein
VNISAIVFAFISCIEIYSEASKEEKLYSEIKNEKESENRFKPSQFYVKYAEKCRIKKDYKELSDCVSESCESGNIKCKDSSNEKCSGIKKAMESICKQSVFGIVLDLYLKYMISNSLKEGESNSTTVEEKCKAFISENPLLEKLGENVFKKNEDSKDSLTIDESFCVSYIKNIDESLYEKNKNYKHPSDDTIKILHVMKKHKGGYHHGRHHDNNHGRNKDKHHGRHNDHHKKKHYEDNHKNDHHKKHDD